MVCSGLTRKRGISSAQSKGADLVLANDSGPMHLAAAMEKEVMALFGPTNPNQYGPWGQFHNVLTAPDDDLAKLMTEQVAKTLMQKLSGN